MPSTASASQCRGRWRRTKPHAVELSLALPEDERWPFGGTAHQRIEAGEGWLKMDLSVRAGERPMPAVIGWHPWFRKPEQLDFSPSGIYPRDDEGIATAAVGGSAAGPLGRLLHQP